MSGELKPCPFCGSKKVRSNLYGRECNSDNYGHYTMSTARIAPLKAQSSQARKSSLAKTDGVVQRNTRIPRRVGLQKALLHRNRGDLEGMEGDFW